MSAQALNPEQLGAVTHGEGPQLVIAGAGSGKTRVITHRIAWLIERQQVDPSAIAAVTFTNKAAQEMRHRVEELLRIEPLPTFVGTFHRFSLVLLRRYGQRVGLAPEFVIFDTKDQLQLIKEALQREGLSDKAFPPRSVLGRISSAKNRLQGPEGFEAEADDYFSRQVAKIYPIYQGLLRRSNAVDFDDMIRFAVKLLSEEELRARWRRRLQWLLVDEFQDTNQAQLALVQALVGEDGNLTAVGDEDQGIYRWRGADLGNILDFEDFFPGATIRKLEQNYRSTQTILDASGAVIANNASRRGKRLWTEAETGSAVELHRAGDEEDEAAWIAGSIQELSSDYARSQQAILVRTHSQTRAVEEQLHRRGIPYVLVGGVRFYERAEIKDLIAYLRLLSHPHDEHALARIINQPPRGIGKGTMSLLEDRARETGLPLWDVIATDSLDSFPARSARALSAFRDLVLDLRELLPDLDLTQILEELLERTSYTDLFSSDSVEDQSRRENVEELLSAAREIADRNPGETGWQAVLSLLDHVALVTDLDDWQEDRGVSLMTLHSAKGLEFPVVFMAGLEDGVLPHFNSQGTIEDLEEERRLFYVGMTRAQERLLISHCRRRRIAGRYQVQDPSPFLSEIPREHLKVSGSSELFRPPGSREVYQFFGRQGSPTRSPRVETERVYVSEDGEGADELAPQHRVRHPTLGEGRILEISGAPRDRRITVFFDRAGKRRLLERYARLELLD